MSPDVTTDARIVAAAAELFAERGYAGTTTRAIAQRAGVNEVTLFRRFENKAGILRALGARFAETSAGFQIEEAADPGDTRATLLALARMEISSAIANGGAALRLAFDARSVPEVAELLGEGPRGSMEALAGYMALRQAAGDLRDDLDARVLAEAFFSMTSSYVMYRMVLGAADVPGDVALDDTVEQLVELFWSGAVAEGGRR